MGWKDWSYAIKCGFLLSTIYLIWIVLLILPPLNLAASFLLSVTQPISFLGPFSNLSLTFQTIIIGLQGLIFYYLLGTLVGWIYGKIKSR